MRPHDWAFFVAIAAAILFGTALLRGSLVMAAGWAVLAIGAGMAARSWSRRHPGPMPHAIRWVLFMPRGPHSPQHLKRILQPRGGERILEIGPGIGSHALPIASSLAPDGILEVLDVQQEMLDDLTRRAAGAGITNIVAKQGDAQRLSYPDQTFDAAYLIAVLGEIPDEAGTLRELRRVIKPNGRLVVGEVLLDPDYVSLSSLQQKARDAGFAFDQKLGSGFAYFARFRPAAVVIP